MTDEQAEKLIDEIHELNRNLSRIADDIDLIERNM